MDRKLSKADCEKIKDLYFKVYCLMYSKKTIMKMAERDIKNRKWYERP